MSAQWIHRLNRIVFYLALAGLLAWAAWLRWAFIRTVQLYPDEFVTLLAVRMIGEKGLPVMPSGLFYEHGFLFSYAGRLAAWLGPPALAVRSASLVFGLLTAGLTFYVGRRWFSPAVGLLAAAGLALAPAAIEWSGRARMYALLQLLTLLALWLAYEGLTYPSARRRWLALLAYLGAALTHFVAVTLAPPLFLAALLSLWFNRSRQVPPGAKSQARYRWAGELFVFTLILAAAFLLKRAGQPKGIEALEAANALPGLAQVFALYSSFAFNPAAGWQAIAPFYLNVPAVIFAPFALLALAASRPWQTSPDEKNQFPNLPPCPPAPLLPALFLGLILLLTTLEMILFVSPDRRDDKYLFMLLPALFLLGAQGMTLAGNWLIVRFRAGSGRPSLWSSLLPLFLAALLLVVTWPKIQARLVNTGDDYERAFAYVREHWQPGDKLLTGTPPAAAFYLDRNDYYAVQRRGGYDYRLLTVGGRAVDRWLASPALRTEAELHQALAGGRVWLVLERWGLQREYYDPAFQQQLLAQVEPVPEAQAQGIFVLRSRPDPQPLAPIPAHPVEATLAGPVRLAGYTLEPDPPAPGQPVRVTLYWQALASLPHDYTVFVHLRRPNGGNAAQADHRPLGDWLPTTLWPAGEMIRESSHLFLPPDLSPGDYELWAGLYRLETGERLAVEHDQSGENAVRLGEVTIR